MDYKKKLKLVEEWYYNPSTTEEEKSHLAILFPELCKNEEERIIKGIKSVLEHYKESGQIVCCYPFVTIDKTLTWLEKQNEQKSTNKIEPKFKVGDWIVRDGGLIIGKVTSFDGEYYHYISPDGIEQPIHISNINNYHLWTIQNAKDGDMLKEDSCTFIIERMKSNGTAIVHCCLFGDDDFDLGSNLSFDVDSTYPATKEQRDLLFSKMKEAGYEWDDKNKKLKQIEQKASIDFSDLKTWKYIVDAVLTKEHGVGQYLDNGRTEIMAKELQDRFGNIMQNFVWSEKDKQILKTIVHVLQFNFMPEERFSGYEEYTNAELINWLESLKKF